MAEPLAPALLAPLADLTRWLEATRTKAVLVGGVAVSLLSKPRFTEDIDTLAWLAEQDWESVLAVAPDHGIVARIDDPIGFARRARVLLLRHTATAIDIDVILGGLPFEELAVEQAMVFDVGGVSVRLPRVEHLLIMKAIANRPQDQQDVAALLEIHPGVDVDVVRRWVREFAQAMSMSGLVDEFERAVERMHPP